MDDEYKVTLTLRRAVQLWDWNEQGPYESGVIPAGEVVTTTLEPGPCDVDDRGFAETMTLLHATAKVPCEDLASDFCDCGDGYGCSHGGWFWCREFDGGNGGHIGFCHGDMTRCPSSQVRKEARAKLEGGSQHE